MKKILASLAMVVLIGGVTAGATRAYFSDTAEVTKNTFATGTLEIRVNGEPTITGADFEAVAPGDMKVFTHNVNNYGSPYFAGPSNLTAKYLRLHITNPNDSGSGLWQEVRIKVEVNRGWSTWQEVWQGKIMDLPTVDLLAPRWTELIPGSSEDVRYTVWLPETFVDQSTLMGKVLTWDFVVEGRTN
jgi:predicted ribosomally synthesized peptide with SipW-like signal peptide